MPPKSPRNRRLASVRDLLKGRAYTLLGLLRIKVSRTLRVQARNRTHQVTIILSPLDGTEDDSGPRPGLWLSPCERLIVERVREMRRSMPAERITQAAIAARAALPLDPGFKAVLRNLVDRQILTQDDAAGYALAAGV